MRATVWLLLLVLATACGDRSPPEPVDQSVRPAHVMTVELSSTPRTLELIGRVQAAQSIDLAFEVAGPLKNLPVLEGQSVSKGDLLAALDPADFQLAVREAEVQLRLAEQDLSRKARVLKQRGIAKSAVDDARSMRDLQRVRLQQARQKLADATLRAPFDGVIAQRFVDQFVNVNVAQPILRLHAGNELYVVANAPEDLTATVTPDEVERVYATFSFAGDTQFPLEVRENRGEADRIAQTVEVSFAMERSSDWNVLPGMTATVHVVFADSAHRGVVLPLAAVVPDAEQSLFVWVVNPATQEVSQRYIDVAETKPEGVVVTSGLNSGEQVVTTGAVTLRAGMRVRPLDV